MSLARWPRALAALAADAGLLALVLAAPALALRLLAKEGPIEHASHVVLLLAALAWLCVALRVRGWARVRAAGMAGFLAFVLAEEVDWGAVYGVSTLGTNMAGAFGHRNMHNALRGASYLLFAAPLALHFAAPARLHGPLTPLRDERVAFLLIAASFIAWNLGAWERQAQELLEAVLYALLLVCGLRLARAA